MPNPVTSFSTYWRYTNKIIIIIIIIIYKERQGTNIVTST